MRDATLVLGGSGFLGVHVAARAARLGETIAASREPEAAPRFHAGASAPIGFARVDVLRPLECEELLERERPARVLVCTALSRNADCEAYPALARALNADLPARVARWCAASGARLVHVSTDLVFGDRSPPPAGFDEGASVGPISLYGETKAAGERAVLESGARALAVRLPLLFGDSGGRGQGASDSLLAALARGERPLLFQDEVRTPLEVACAARALVELAWGDLQGLLHVAGPERISRAELGLEVLRASGMPESEARARVVLGLRADAGAEATRPADVSLDASRARALLATELAGVRASLSAPAR